MSRTYFSRLKTWHIQKLDIFKRMCADALSLSAIFFFSLSFIFSLATQGLVTRQICSYWQENQYVTWLNPACNTARICFLLPPASLSLAFLTTPSPSHSVFFSLSLFVLSLRLYLHFFPSPSLSLYLCLSGTQKIFDQANLIRSFKK